MKRSLSERINRLVVEALVITSSILLAFALDAWWDSRKDYLEETALLASLTVEFNSVQAELTRARAVHSSRLGATEALLNMIDEGAPHPDPAALWTLMVEAHTSTTFDPPNGELTSAVASGALNLIQDGALRALIAAWPGWVADHQRTEANARTYIFEVLMPWLAQKNAFPPLAGPYHNGWAVRSNQILDDPAYRGHLWFLHKQSMTILTENDSVAAEVNDVLALLQGLTARR